MVLGHEVELDHVVLGGLDTLGGVDETGRAADGDLEVGISIRWFREVEAEGEEHTVCVACGGWTAVFICCV